MVWAHWHGNSRFDLNSHIVEAEMLLGWRKLDLSKPLDHGPHVVAEAGGESQSRIIFNPDSTSSCIIICYNIFV